MVDVPASTAPESDVVPASKASWVSASEAGTLASLVEEFCSLELENPEHAATIDVAASVAEQAKTASDRRVIISVGRLNLEVVEVVDPSDASLELGGIDSDRERRDAIVAGEAGGE